jgi:hypothetical protein
MFKFSELDCDVKYPVRRRHPRQESYQRKVPEHVGLPHPANIVGSHFTYVFEEVIRCGEGGDGTFQELLPKGLRINAREAQNTGIEDDV